MKNTFTNVLSFFALTLMISVSLHAEGAYKKGYYDAMDGKQKIDLKQAAKQCVSSHTRLDYYELPTYWQYSDIYPEKYQGSRRWWEMYSNEIYLITSNQTPKSSFSANKMQREHSIPKSWWKQNNDVEYTPAYSDMWNLYPSDGPANQAKLNYPLGECRSTTFDNGCTKVGPAKTGQGGGSGYVFEPADEYKGDFARTCFYMATVYDDLPWVITYMFKKETWPTLQPWAMTMLLQWARQDPVSEKEILRNDGVERSQGNRNPFVDFPELAEYIWGTRTSETFYISEQGGNVTPPITGEAELTLPVTGSTLDFGPTAEGVAVSAWLRIAGKNLTSDLSVSLGGSDRASFRPGLTSIPASYINGQEYYDLPIIFTPSHTGRHEARIVLYDGGLTSGAGVSVTLIAEAAERPDLSTLTALPPTDITATSYTANWTKAPEVVDYYIITRTRYTNDDVEVDEYQSDVNSYTFTDRNPMVMETYTVRSSRLGVESEISNTITVEATGINNIAAHTGDMLFATPDGFIVAQEAPDQTICIYEPAGRMLQQINATAGDRFTLPGGIYIITSDKARRPLKVVVL